MPQFIAVRDFATRDSGRGSTHLRVPRPEGKTQSRKSTQWPPSPPILPRRERTLKMWLALRNSRVKLNLYSGCVHPSLARANASGPSRLLSPGREPVQSRKRRYEGSDCTFLSNSLRVEVTGVFQAVDAKHENLVIADLDSGIGVVPVALVRWSDVLSMTTLPPAETEGSGPTTPMQASHAS